MSNKICLLGIHVLQWDRSPRGLYDLQVRLLSAVLSEADEVMVESAVDEAEVTDETAEELTGTEAELRAGPVPSYGNCLL